MKGCNEMINMKNDKGITLLAEVMAVAVVVMIIAIISYSSMSSFQVRKLNNMYADIVNIQEKAANYYLKYGEAPVDKTSPVIMNNVPDTQKNVNDDVDKYYKVDFSKLLNVTLNNEQTMEEYYYMNEKTLTTYYSKGVTIDNLNSEVNPSITYYTVPSNYEDITTIDLTLYQEEN